MVTSVSDYHAPILPLKKPYFTGSQGIERVKETSPSRRAWCHQTKVRGKATKTAVCVEDKDQGHLWPFPDRGQAYSNTAFKYLTACLPSFRLIEPVLATEFAFLETRARSLLTWPP